MDAVSRLRQLEQQLSASGETPRLLLELARVWRKLGNPETARQYAQRAIQLGECAAGAWNTLGATLVDLREWEQAETAFRRALRLDPGVPHAEHNLALALRQQAWKVHEAARRADWKPFGENGQRLLRLHRARMKQNGGGLIAPFSVLGFHLTPSEQRAAAEAQAREFLAANAISTPASVCSRPPPGDRIRVGYLSADFRNNAAGHLLHRLFGCHDRARFEIFALSYGPEDGSEFRRAIKAGVEHFEELRSLDDEAAAARIRDLGIDLVVDLMGFAGNHRAGILARRPAPLQVSWLGYCMTTGAPWIDAFIGDSIALPGELEPAFSERVVRLPDSYQVCSGQPFDRGARRGEFGLPDDAMVYCCFNMPEKVDPAIWARWMQILSAVPSSVLWLLVDDETTTNHYRRQVAAAGVDPARIIPATLLPKREHLARAAVADLFLDTPLCNAHTTASDALWAGLPVLTYPGRLFAQRVAASVCQAAGLPDLVVDSLDDYVATAIELGQDLNRIRTLKQKLASARDHAPLFDVSRFARNLEAVFERLVEKRRTDLSVSKTGKLPLVLVLGTWRSGTSALAGVLHHLGVYMGAEFATLRNHAAHRQTWEPFDFFDIVWASLSEPDMSPLRPTGQTAAELKRFLQKQESLTRRAGSLIFGLKHPALSLLAPMIKEIWPDVRTVRTERDLDESWNSMQRIGWQWPEARTRLGLERQRAAAQAHCDGPVFHFPAFLHTPEDTVDRLIAHIGMEPDSPHRQQAIESLMKP